tara:strand:- start:88 stop:744 length:657 start_codon:yes stop_codon:yes gene_type:complete
MSSAKKIWMCWFQGEDSNTVPPLNKKCISLWKQLNPEHEVNILNIDTIKDYVPEFFEIIENSPNRSWAAKSDLLRVLLLSKYGGVWADASVYPVMPLNEFYKLIVNHTKFFTYRFVPRGSYDNRKKCETVSWFLCADEPQLYLIEKWKEAFVNNFKTMSHWPYFTFHETLTELYDTDPVIKTLLNDMVQIDEKIPHSAQHGWHSKKPSFVYKRPHISI